MDQLKAILVYRFWILSALALLIPPVGWWMTTGDMAKLTDDRTKAIETKAKNIQTLNRDIAKTANEQWIASARQANANLDSVVVQTHKQLYDHQRPTMVWHPLVQQALDKSKIKYRQENPGDPQEFLKARRLFVGRYYDEWQRTMEIVDPFNSMTGNGKVLVAAVGGDITRGPLEQWQRDGLLSAGEMWDAQEDLWMLKAMLKAVARVNEGSVSIDDAIIRKLQTAKLRGGSQSDLQERRKPKAAIALQGPNGTQPLIPMDPSDTNVARRGNAPVKEMPLIDPDDIFGADESTQSLLDASKKSSGGRQQQPQEQTSAHTYIDSSVPPGKWRSRGFVLRVVMDHREIPKLVTALTQSPFPVQIFHVEHVRYDSEKALNQPPPASGTGGDDGAEQKRLKSINDRLNMALSQAYLADVLVAGTFTFYDEPPLQAATGTAAVAPKAAATPSAPTPTAPTATPATKPVSPTASQSGPLPIVPPSTNKAGTKSPSPPASPSPRPGGTAVPGNAAPPAAPVSASPTKS